MAVRVGLADTAAFHCYVQSQETKEITQERKELGDSLGIHGTPSFIINNKLVVGELSMTQLNGLVRDAFTEMKR